MRDLLKTISLFSYFDDHELNELSRFVYKKNYPKNTILFSEGDEPDCLYAVLKGKVWILLNNIHGKELVLTIHEEGDYFGEMALIDDSPRSATAMTKDEVELLLLQGKEFKHLLAANPNMVFNLLKSLTHRFRRATDKIEDFAFLNVYGRIVRVITQHAKPVGNRLVVEERLTHQEIANMIGATREMVSKILKKLCDAGYIVVKDKHIEIHQNLPFSF